MGAGRRLPGWPPWGGGEEFPAIPVALSGGLAGWTSDPGLCEEPQRLALGTVLSVSPQSHSAALAGVAGPLGNEDTASL